MHVVHRMTTDNLKCAGCLCNVYSHTADLSHGSETQLLPVQLAASFESCSISVYTASTVIHSMTQASQEVGGHQLLYSVVTAAL